MQVYAGEINILRRPWFISDTRVQTELILVLTRPIDKRVSQLVVGFIDCHLISGSHHKGHFVSSFLSGSKQHFPQTSMMTARAYETGMVFPALSPGRLRVYSMRFCPFAQRTLLILKAKHIDHEVINIHLEKRPEWASDVFRTGTVPVLQQDDKLISGSIVIAEYLEEAYGSPKLLPSDPYLRALDRSFLEVALPILQPLLNFYFKCGSGADEDWSAFREKAGIFEKELGVRKTKYLSGEKPGYVDFVAWPTFAFAQALSTVYEEPKMPTDEQHPLLSAWCKNMRQDPVVTSVIDESSTLEFMQSARGNARNFNAGL